MVEEEQERKQNYQIY